MNKLALGSVRADFSVSVVAAGSEPDTLRGHASIYVDIAPFYPPTASVTAVRVPCRLTSA